MSTKIRLGPIAIFLTVIAIVFASLAMLTVATSRADAALARRFAAVTKTKYELEADGNRFVQAAEEYRQGGALPSGAEERDGELEYSTEKDGYTLKVRLTEAADGYQISEWRIIKLWEADDPFEDLWQGN